MTSSIYSEPYELRIHYNKYPTPNIVIYFKYKPYLTTYEVTLIKQANGELHGDVLAYGYWWDLDNNNAEKLYDLLKITDYLEANNKTAIELDLTTIANVLYSLA